MLQLLRVCELDLDGRGTRVTLLVTSYRDGGSFGGDNKRPTGARYAGLCQRDFSNLYLEPENCGFSNVDRCEETQEMLYELIAVVSLFPSRLTCFQLLNV